NVYVYANDSDLIVLGVRALLYEASERNRQLSGVYINTDFIFKPPEMAFRRNTTAHAFLRLLHGLPTEYDPALVANPLPDATARDRLLLYAIVVGNDYAKFEHIGPAAAGRLLQSLP
ncbi:unnamed protein product, partial [Pylaiella littoralis]